MIEHEVRYRLSPAQFAMALEAMPPSSVLSSERVSDVTFGLAGASSMDDHGWIVRLRRSDRKMQLQFKSRGSDPTSWRELSVGVDSLAICAQMLEAMGLSLGLVIRRTRTEVNIWDCVLSFDFVDLLGYFVEIEFQTTDALSRVRSEMAALGLNLLAAEPSYGDLLMLKAASDPRLLSVMSAIVDEVLA